MATLTKRHAVFACIVAASLVLYGRTIFELVKYAFSDQSYSHIVVIPLISLFLVYTERRAIFSETHSSIGLGTGIAFAGILACWSTVRFLLVPSGNDSLSAAALSLVILWIGGFLACYGGRAMRTAIFPLLFLVLMVPLPGPILAKTISLLQRGSTDVAYFTIKSVGVPVLRQGLFLSLPGLNIEIATECSGIRSSMALLITCLLAAHYFLRTPWKMFVFVALALPLAVVKNGVRIATLAILSVYVDPGFLSGRLHREGGFVFFFLMLAILWPILILLQRSENPGDPLKPAETEKTGSELARG
jgi:exosortase